MASLRWWPHISAVGRSDKHTAGRSGWPNSRQRSASSSCTQRTPAGLPCGMPGMAELMEGAVQQAPQAGRQFIAGNATAARSFVGSVRGGTGSKHRRCVHAAS
jgi:hypothetical protein